MEVNKHAEKSVDRSVVYPGSEGDGEEGSDTSVLGPDLTNESTFEINVGVDVTGTEGAEVKTYKVWDAAQETYIPLTAEQTASLAANGYFTHVISFSGTVAGRPGSATVKVFVEADPAQPDKGPCLQISGTPSRATVIESIPDGNIIPNTWTSKSGDGTTTEIG